MRACLEDIRRGVPPTPDSIYLEAIIEELGFDRRGHRIVESLRRAIREIRTGSGARRRIAKRGDTR